MKYIKKFSTETAYDLESDEFIFPTVSYINEENEVRYVKYRNHQQEYLTFEAIDDCVFTIEFYTSHNDTLSQSSRTSYSYSLDNGETWTTYTAPSGGVTGTTTLLTTPTISAGNKVLWKGIGTGNSTISQDPMSTYVHFTSTGDFKAYGNIMSLLYGDEGFDVIDLSDTEYAFNGMFRDCTNLVCANGLSLPATALGRGAYCYMFQDCTSLIAPPVLPATTLAASCYQYMFRGCSSLETPPRLPATELAEYCYDNMFNGCTSLKFAPVLHAATLAADCYEYMFYDCTNLNYIKALFTTEPILTSWVYGVAPKGVFVKSHLNNWSVVGNNGIPVGWTVKTDIESDAYYYNGEGVGSFDII